MEDKLFYSKLYFHHHWIFWSKLNDIIKINGKMKKTSLKINNEVKKNKKKTNLDFNSLGK